MKLALVEFSESHEECLFSQVQFLKGQNLKVDLFVNPALLPRVGKYQEDCDNVHLIPQKKGLLKRLWQAVGFAKTLGEYDKVIFNTASSSKLLRNTVVLLKTQKVECLGLLHNTKRLNHSFTQKLISIKIKKYFVLNDHLLNIEPKDRKVKLQSFYPIYFPANEPEIKKPVDETWFLVPGSIDFERRNYDILIDALTDNKALKKFKIILLGKLNKAGGDGKKLYEKITSNRLESHFVTYTNFIPNNLFHSVVQQSDFVLPLLKLDESYLRYKISGSFNLAFGYKKPMIMHKFFESIPDLNRNSIFYEEHSLLDTMRKAIISKPDTANFYTHAKWNFEVQREKYLNFLFAK